MLSDTCCEQMCKKTWHVWIYLRHQWRGQSGASSPGCGCCSSPEGWGSSQTGRSWRRLEGEGYKQTSWTSKSSGARVRVITSHQHFVLTARCFYTGTRKWSEGLWTFHFINLFWPHLKYYKVLNKKKTGGSKSDEIQYDQNFFSILLVPTCPYVLCVCCPLLGSGRDQVLPCPCGRPYPHCGYGRRRN